MFKIFKPLNWTDESRDRPVKIACGESYMTYNRDGTYSINWDKTATDLGWRSHRIAKIQNKDVEQLRKIVSSMFDEQYDVDPIVDEDSRIIEQNLQVSEDALKALL